MVKCTLELHKALDKLIEMDRHNVVAKTCLRWFKLQPNEWELLIQLWPLLVVSHIQFSVLLSNGTSVISQSDQTDVSIKSSTPPRSYFPHWHHNTHTWKGNRWSVSLLCHSCISCKRARGSQQVLLKDRRFYHVLLCHEWVIFAWPETNL